VIIEEMMENYERVEKEERATVTETKDISQFSSTRFLFLSLPLDFFFGKDNWSLNHP
jgi:hypothetical protein